MFFLQTYERLHHETICVFSSLFPLSLVHSSICSFFISTPLLMLFFSLRVCQMGLLCGQVFRQETGSLRYRVHPPPYSNYQLYCFLLRVTTEATGCHLVVTQCAASLCSAMSSWGKKVKSGRFGVITYLCKCSF